MKNLIPAEELSVKTIFDLVQKLGKGDYDTFSVFELNDDDGKRFRINVKNLGNFEVGMFFEPIQLQLKRGDWICIEQPYYRYSCCSTSFNGDPLITDKQALDIIKI